MWAFSNAKSSAYPHRAATAALFKSAMLGLATKFVTAWIMLKAFL